MASTNVENAPIFININLNVVVFLKVRKCGIQTKDFTVLIRMRKVMLLKITSNIFWIIRSNLKITFDSEIGGNVLKKD